jgi:hypothetical protein
VPWRPTVSKLSAPEVIGQGRRRDERGSINAKMAADNHHNLLGKVSQSSSRPGSSSLLKNLFPAIGRT